MAKQKFEIRIAVGGDDEKLGVKVEVWKDGKFSDFRLLDGENLRLAYEGTKYAMGIVARLYLSSCMRTEHLMTSNIRSSIRNNISHNILLTI